MVVGGAALFDSGENERQRWDICEEFSVWHFVTKSTGLNPKMSSHFSESRDHTCVKSAKCPKCPWKEWRTKSFRLQSTLHPRDSGPKCVQGPAGVTTSPTLLGTSWCGASRTIWDCCWSWDISGPPRAAAPATLPKGKAGTKMRKSV